MPAVATLHGRVTVLSNVVLRLTQELATAQEKNLELIVSDRPPMSQVTEQKLASSAPIKIMRTKRVQTI